MDKPLADRLRPQTLDDMVGQQHLIKKGAVLRQVIESGKVPNMVFYGPTGVGKTTLARIIANYSNKRLFCLNGTTASSADIKRVAEESSGLGSLSGVLLYLDEIQYLNKKQQQLLIDYIETGSVTLIASTAENPYFYVYNAILSRSTVFEFKPITPKDIIYAIDRALLFISDELGTKITATKDSKKLIATKAAGDLRRAINMIEIIMLTLKGNNITIDTVKNLSFDTASSYDINGDQHFDILSAFQKSIRGSDVNAALHYLARLIAAGDILSPIRRLLVIASEDIGLAYPLAISVVKACTDSAVQLGLPEARIVLAQAVIFLATLPKSNSVITAIDKALSDVKSGKGNNIPSHLKDAHFEGANKLNHGVGYRYPHDYKHNFIKQQYLPDDLKDITYYEYGNNKTELAAKEYWRGIKTDPNKD